MRLLVLDDEGIAGHLMQLEDGSKAIRKEISDMIMTLDGCVSWTECWNMSREDRLNILESFSDHQRKMKKVMNS